MNLVILVNLVVLVNLVNLVIMMKLAILANLMILAILVNEFFDPCISCDYGAWLFIVNFGQNYQIRSEL